MEQKKRENVPAGIVGAFLGSLIGVACAVLIGQLGYVASVSGLVMAVCALKGYELLGGSLTKKGGADFLPADSGDDLSGPSADLGGGAG